MALGSAVIASSCSSVSFCDCLRSPALEHCSFQSAPASCSALSFSGISVTVATDNSSSCNLRNKPNALPNRVAILDRTSADEDLRSSVSSGSPLALQQNQKNIADSLRFGELEPDYLSYREKFAIRCYEVGMNRTASIETIANLLQEVACNHAQSVGFSTEGFATTPSMRKLRLIWVTTRMHIEVDEYPVWGDVVDLETWCQSEGKVGTRRDWLMKNAATGKVIGRATSTWVMMNEDTRKLSRITDDVREEYSRYCPVVPRYVFPEENSASVKKTPKLEDPAGYIRPGLMPRRGDLDMNQHVNNVTYIGWTLESMPQDLIETHQLHRITLDYRRECGRDDAVDSLASPELSCDMDESGHKFPKAASNGAATNGAFVSKAKNDDNLEFLHLLRLARTQIEINRGRTVWKKK